MPLAFSTTLGFILMLGAQGWSFFYYFLADASFIRNLLLAALGPIDWVFIFGERRQRLGDKAAGTIVVDDE